MTKITTDFVGTETLAVTKTRLDSILSHYGYSTTGYTTWGNARTDMNLILSGTSIAPIADNELASSFITKLNELNTGDYGLQSLQWNDSTDTYVTTAAMPVPGVHDRIRRCILNADGTVNYYLHPTNSTLKADGVTPAVLDGTDGYVMVEIPKFWFRRDLASNVHTWELSGVARTGFDLHPAFVKNGVEVNYRYISAYDACLWFTRSVTAVADAGGGSITFTTSQTHPLYVGDVVTISGTTDYNATYTVTARGSDTTFTAVGAFTSSQTGTATGYVSGKNLDNMSGNIQTGVDKLASVSGQYPLVGVQRAECRTLAANNGTGWHQLDFALWSAIQMLYLVEYGTLRSQSVLGAGNTNSSYLTSDAVQTNSPHTIAGVSNTTFANASTDGSQPSAGARPGTAYMSYRGIENLFGNCWSWADGINVNITTAGTVYITNNSANFADDTATGHTLVTSSLPTASGFIRNLLNTTAYFLSSTNSGGSSTTFVADQHFASASLSRVVFVGGSAIFAASAGVFCLNSSDVSSFRSRNIGARVCR
jgi:hypothetical protein